MKLNLKEAREACGLTQLEMARLLGINDVTLSGYELGKHNPKTDTLIKIAQLCNVTVDYLLGREEPEESAEEAPLSPEALALARAYDGFSEYGKAMIDAIMQQEEKTRHKLAKAIHVIPTAHDSDIYARYLSNKETREIDPNAGLIIHHKKD